MSFETKESLASELVTFVDNDGVLYQGQTLSIIKNLVKKMASGKYDPEKAVKLFMYLAESGARKYDKEFGGSESGWHDMFPVDVRKMAATHWRDSFESEAKLGNYDEYVPKKYQKKTSAAAKSDKQTKAYKDGFNLALQMAQSLSKAEIEHIVQSKTVFAPIDHPLNAPHIPAKNRSPNPDHRRGYLRGMQNVLDAMDGN